MPRVLVQKHVVYTGCYRTLLTNLVLPFQGDSTLSTASRKENEEPKTSAEQLMAIRTAVTTLLPTVASKEK
jgi:hypothetical protein